MENFILFGICVICCIIFPLTLYVLQIRDILANLLREED